MKLLVLGRDGQVGTALQKLLPAVGDIVALGRDGADFEVPGRLAEIVARERPDVILNAAAYTAVDKAESEPELAAAINAEAPGLLAAAAASKGIPIIHVSTDYVFAADGEGPWREDAPIAPASTYGRSKAAGEEAVIASGARYAIVRTAWVVSADGSNFIKTMLRLGAERDHLRVVADQRGTPTHAGDLAAALAAITTRFTADPDQPSGLWHCANAGETTWHGLAAHVFARAAALGLEAPHTVAAITTADYPTPARRPRDSRLDCAKLAADFGIKLRPWQEAVDDIVGTLAQQEQTA